MEKRKSIMVNTCHPNILKKVRQYEEFGKELQRRNLGQYISETGEFVYDDINEAEVSALFDKFINNNQ
ncbi:MAG: hypothetical protein LUD48_02395 [Prevotella sp.]|nr:hypothetical protein [Prevotella sp.]